MITLVLIFIPHLIENKESIFCHNFQALYCGGYKTKRLGRWGMEKEVSRVGRGSYPEIPSFCFCFAFFSRDFDQSQYIQYTYCVTHVLPTSKNTYTRELKNHTGGLIIINCLKQRNLDYQLTYQFRFITENVLI